MSTPTTVDIDYYEWLKSQVDIPNGKTYDDLFELMHNTEFIWMVPHDDNRIADALELRQEFLGGAIDTVDFRLDGATFLEVLVALSRRVAFTSEKGNPQHWAWHLLKNLGLQPASDPMGAGWRGRAEAIIHAVIWRTYHADGNGGFFPLQNAEQDQRKLDLWYQMNAYVAEMTDL